jgi:hypothetical protein
MRQRLLVLLVAVIKVLWPRIIVGSLLVFIPDTYFTNMDFAIMPES